MLGIVVVGYDDFAAALLKAVQIGKNQQLDGLCAVSIKKSTNPADIEANRQALFRAIAQVESGSGVLVLTDSLHEDGGMIAPSLMEDAVIEIVAGVNLPMLSEAVTHRSSDNLAAVAHKVMEAGRIAIARHSIGP